MQALAYKTIIYLLYNAVFASKDLDFSFSRFSNAKYFYLIDITAVDEAIDVYILYRIVTKYIYWIFVI